MWHRIVLDESHYIKNPSAQWSKACLELRGANKWCVTGTPMGTSMTDMASQLDFVGWGADGEVGCVREITQALGGQVGSRHQRWRYGVNHGFDEKTLYRLHRRTMRHTMTQKRHGRSLLELPAQALPLARHLLEALVVELAVVHQLRLAHALLAHPAEERHVEQVAVRVVDHVHRQERQAQRPVVEAQVQEVEQQVLEQVGIL